MTKYYGYDIERVAGDSWNVYIPQLDIGFFHTAAEGGRDTIVAHVTRVIEELTRDKGFGLVLGRAW